MAAHRFSRLALASMTTVLVACGSGGETPAQQELQILSNQDRATLSDQSGLLPGDSGEQEERCVQSVLDDALLEAVNVARREARWCGDTHYEAVPAVSWQCDLEKAAQRHADDMADNNFFAHIGSDGLRVSHRVDRTGYDWSMVGENIAAGYTRVDSVVQGWLESPGHCGTIMNADYVHVANAIALPADANYATYWTLVMARPR